GWIAGRTLLRAGAAAHWADEAPRPRVGQPPLSPDRWVGMPAAPACASGAESGSSTAPRDWQGTAVLRPRYLGGTAAKDLRTFVRPPASPSPPGGSRCPMAASQLAKELRPLI